MLIFIKKSSLFCFYVYIGNFYKKPRKNIPYTGAYYAKSKFS